MSDKPRAFCSQRSFGLSRCSPKALTQSQQAVGLSKKVRGKAIGLKKADVKIGFLCNNNCLFCV
ncbi:MAG: hypothetical protein COS30_00085, partial [Candidatus Portnoybacteria bacterium CG02_land_8_20_14_3_00_45_8]